METVWNDENEIVSSWPYSLILKDELKKLSSDENIPADVDWNLNVINNLSRFQVLCILKYSLKFHVIHFIFTDFCFLPNYCVLL